MGGNESPALRIYKLAAVLRGHTLIDVNMGIFMFFLLNKSKLNLGTGKRSSCYKGRFRFAMFFAFCDNLHLTAKEGLGFLRVSCICVHSFFTTYIYLERYLKLAK